MTPPAEWKATARDRILETAYELFSRRGVRDVGVDEVIQRASVAKATLYRHFPSKDDLVVPFLDLREQRWSKERIEAEAKRRGATAEEQLLAVFDVFDDWFHRDDYEACSFIKVLTEMGPEHPAGLAAISHLANIRSDVRELAAEEGDLEAARRAQSIARLLIDASR